MKMFFDIVISVFFLVTNPLIYSFTLKVFYLKIQIECWNENENNEWSTNSFVIKKVCKFHVAATEKGVYE